MEEIPPADLVPAKRRNLGNILLKEVEKGKNQDTHANIETRISFPPCHLQPYHKNLESISLNNLDKTVRSFEIMLDIPCHQNINENEIDKITSIILANV